MIPKSDATERHTKIFHLYYTALCKIKALDGRVFGVGNEGAIFLGDSQTMDGEFGLVGQAAVKIGSSALNVYARLLGEFRNALAYDR
jgi:hypothetical protein